MATLLELQSEINVLKQELALLRRQLAHLPVRWGSSSGGAGTTVKRVKVVGTVPTQGRRAYTGREVPHEVVGGVLMTKPDLQTDITFYNVLETANGTSFLVVGDEVALFASSGIELCAEIPRGFP